MDDNWLRLGFARPSSTSHKNDQHRERAYQQSELGWFRHRSEPSGVEDSVPLVVQGYTAADVAEEAAVAFGECVDADQRVAVAVFHQSRSA